MARSQLILPFGYIVVEGDDPPLTFLAPFVSKFAASIAVHKYAVGATTLDSFLAGRTSGRDMSVAAMEIEDRPYLLFEKIPGPPLSNERRLVNGQPARQLVFRVPSVALPRPIEHDPLDFSAPPSTTIIIDQVFIKRGMEVWVFTMNSTEDVSAKYRSEFADLLQHIRWKENPQ